MTQTQTHNKLIIFAKKILVFTQSKFTLRDYKRFGVEFLAEKGFEITVFDFSPILREPAYVESPQPGELVDFPRLFRIGEIPQFEACLAQQGLSGGYALCFIELLHREIPIFLSLSKFEIKYCHFFTGVTPNIQPYWRKLLSKCYYAFKVYVMYRAIKPADAIFCAGKSAKHFLGFKKGSVTRIIDVGSFDYCSFMQRLPTLQDEDIEGEEFHYPDIVFVDQFIPHHPDFQGQRIIEAGKYYTLVNRFLEEMVRQLGLTVGIAAHPRADYRENPFSFPLISKDTVQLIYHARAVVGHYSTAFSFALLSNKPIIQLSFKEMSGTITYKTIEKLSLEIGTQILYLDTEMSVLRSIPAIDQKKYENFITKYLIADRNIEKPDLLEALYHYLLQQ